MPLILDQIEKEDQTSISRREKEGERGKKEANTYGTGSRGNITSIVFLFSIHVIIFYIEKKDFSNFSSRSNMTRF